ncbi:MAG TPA: SBBP repeat-containing protein [Nitrospiria bacterium]|nr:SBBP repeat-containing protein [Nitrospiria bacterium]
MAHPRAWLLALALLTLVVLTLPAAAATARSQAHLPVEFEINQGQSDPRVTFLAHGAGATLYLTSNGTSIRLVAGSAHAAGPRASKAPHAAVVTTTWLGASTHPAIEGQGPLEARSNYFIGNNPSRWRTNVPHFARVRYRGLYPGIDLVYYGSASRGYGSASDGRDEASGGSGSASTDGGDVPRLEYDLIVAPGADPGVIRLAVDGAESATVDERGDLRLTTAAGVMIQQKPVVYQEIDGAHRPVAGSYTLRRVHANEGRSRGRYEVGIALGSYDPARPLVIDPVLDLSSYWGGSADDVATAIAVDANTGAIALAGYTDSTMDFPIVDPVPGVSVTGASTYAFVTKLNQTQKVVSYSTFIGGINVESGNPPTTEAMGVEMDNSGSVFVTGWTNTTDFPIEPNDSSSNDFAYQVNYGGGDSDAFVMKIEKKGNAIKYATYLGGTGSDQANSIRITASNAFVTGTTSSTDFPTKVPWQSTYGGGASDAFVAEVDSKGKSLAFSTYLGGSGEEQGLALAIGSGGSSTVTGWTNSYDFPTHVGQASHNPLQKTYGGGLSDAFVTHLSGDGRSVLYSTYLGGSGDDVGYAIFEASNTPFVTGSTTSKNSDVNPFPTTTNAIQTDNAGGEDAFISRLDTKGETLRFSTYLGGSGDDAGFGIERSPEGFIYVTGETDSATSFPLKDALQPTYGGGSSDAFLLRLNTDYTLDYSTFWGGDGADIGRAIVLDVGAVYVTGITQSDTNSFRILNPITVTSPPANVNYIGDHYSGGTDVFLLKVLDNQTSGCNMGSLGRPFSRYGRIDPGLPAVVALAGVMWLIRRLRRIRKSSGRC